MKSKRFKSKIDRWLLYMLIAVIIFEVVVLGMAATQAGSLVAALSIVAAALLIVVLIGSLLVRTHYTIAGNTVRIASGPFSWTVPIDQIESVKATRNPLSSPALSLDRLQISYGNGRKIMISPADKAGFLKAIGQELVE
jgi:membrane protein YdbS with pleckstrin-like domain